MSTQHRTTHNSMEDTSGGSGCAIFLIVAGLGVAAMAIAFGLIIAVFTIDSSETEASVSEVVIEDVINEVEQPTESTESTESLTQPLPGTYPERIAGITDRIRTASGNYTRLMSRIGERDAAWEAEMFEVVTVWRDADAEVDRIVPPPAHQVSHELLKQATELYRQTAEEVERSILDSESDPSSNGAETLTSAAVALQLAESRFDSEID